MVGVLVSILIAQVQIPDPLVAISKKYSVVVDVVTEPYTLRGWGYVVEGTVPKPEDLVKYVKIFASEWNRYPVSVIRSAKMKRIVIGAGITLNKQVRAAVPAFESNTMVYDATLGSYNEPYQRLVIHHEFFHMIDQVQGIMGKDPEWRALNPADFHYGTGGEKMRNLGAGILTDKLPGVLTPYAMSAIEEDKAELFGHLLVDREYVTGRMKADPVIDAKAALLKARLLKWDAGFNNEFWNSKAEAKNTK